MYINQNEEQLRAADTMVINFKDVRAHKKVNFDDILNDFGLDNEAEKSFCLSVCLFDGLSFLCF